MYKPHNRIIKSALPPHLQKKIDEYEAKNGKSRIATREVTPEGFGPQENAKPGKQTIKRASEIDVDLPKGVIFHAGDGDYYFKKPNGRSSKYYSSKKDAEKAYKAFMAKASVETTASEYDDMIVELKAKLKFPSFAELITAKDSGIYAAFDLHPKTANNIAQWGMETAVKDRLIEKGEMHVTTVYSPKPFPFSPLGRYPIQCKFKEFMLLGEGEEKTTLVATLDCPFLHKLFNKRSGAGAQWSFPSYIPHITVAKNVSQEEMQDLPPFEFPILLTEEYSDPLDEDFSYDDDKSTKVDASFAARRIDIWLRKNGLSFS